MTAEENKLDNPAWHSLAEVHQNFAIDYEGIRFYQPDYCPFGGFTDPAQTFQGIDNYSDLTRELYVIGEKPLFSKNLILTKDLVCCQMVLFNPVTIEIIEPIIELQTTGQKSDLFNLVNLVQPGYFKNKTPEMGKYFGIYKNDKLIAVTGERMKMNAYTEVSAVVTRPGYTGKGYAKQLIAHTTRRIFMENKLPYLHVAETNTGAIQLYEKLGFSTRRKISFWNLTKNEKKGS